PPGPPPGLRPPHARARRGARLPHAGSGHPVPPPVVRRDRGGTGWPRPLALVPVFAAAFLQFEIARKTRSAAPHDPADYSSVLPWRVCAASIAALGEAAVWGLAGAAAPERPRDRRSVVARAPLALTPLPVWVVLDLLRGTRYSPRTAPSVGLLLALYLAIPLITLEVQRT